MTNKGYYVEQRCTRMLLETGVPANLQGFRYLRSAIIKVVEDPELLNAITKKLYPAIASIYAVTASVIERSIRHSIDVAFNRKGVSGLNGLFEFEICDYHYKTSNSELIALLAEKISAEIKEIELEEKNKEDNHDDKNEN